MDGYSLPVRSDKEIEAMMELASDYSAETEDPFAEGVLAGLEWLWDDRCSDPLE
jgi:hypothetical protein